MPQVLARKIAAAYAVALGFLLFIGGAAWWNLTQFKDTFRWVDHTHQVLYQLEATLTELLALQSNSRGFALTADENLLHTYEADEAALRTTLGHLRQIVADNPGQLSRLDQLEPLIAQSIDLQRERIALRRTAGLAAVSQNRVNTTNPPVMTRISEIIAAMETEERSLLAGRSAEAQTRARLMGTVIIGGSLLAIAIVLVTARVSRRAQRARQQAERELRRSEAAYRTLFDSIDEGYCILEMIFDGQDKATDYRFLKINPAFEKQTGLAGAEGRRMRELAPQHEEHWFEIYGRIALTGEPARFQNYAAQLARWFDVYAFRYGDPANRQVAVLFSNITERKRHEERIRELNADLLERANQLEALNRELEAFSYSVSHDLRAPLRHIDGFAGLLQKNSAAALDDQGRRHLATISGAARQMGRLIDDLLSFSRMGRSLLQPGEIDQDALVAAVIRDGGYDQAGPPIKWRIAPLPRVRADAAMLRQVWANLLGNAVKYSAKVPAPCIEVGHQADLATCEQVFFIRDNGAGFDMRYIDKLFGVFQRLHGPAEFEGTGIGLANVRRIITRHGGRTWAEGRVGEGATFYFSLPTPAPTS